MTSTLEVYREFASRPERTLTVEDLEARGFRRNHAHTMLSRLQSSGLAYRAGRNRVKLLLPSEAAPVQMREDPLVRELTRKGAKATGFSVLPRRYPGERPHEFVVPSGKASEVAAFVAETHPELRVSRSYRPDDRMVCIYAGPVRGEKARTEEALLHVFRHAPRSDFALALQAVLQETTKLNWQWLRRQKEWPELAGVFVALNEISGRDVFPHFTSAELPDLSYDELETAAQALTARGGSPGR